MQERFIVAVDPGDSRISLTVSMVKDGVASVVHYADAPSQGIRHGTIFNPKKVCVPLGSLIRGAEEALDMEIHEVVIPYPRWKVSTKQIRYNCKRTSPSDFISEEEIENLRMMALDDFKADLDPGFEIYGAVAQHFSTEDLFQVRENDIAGVTGEQVEGVYNVYYGSKRAVDNLDKVLCELNLSSRKYFLPEAIGDTILGNDDKEQGVALIEIGGGVTSVSVFNLGVLRFYDSFPFGGKSVSGDIKIECGIPEALAENIKLGYGSCMPDRLFTLADKTLEIQGEGRSESQQLPVKYLAEVIGSRMREIASAALYLIGKSGYSDRLRSGIVLCGGGAEILSCSALFAEMSGLDTRVAAVRHPLIITEGCPELSFPSAVSQLAMISIAAENAKINCATTKEAKIEEETIPGNEPTLFNDNEDIPPQPPIEDNKPQKPTKGDKGTPRRPRPTPMGWFKELTQELFNENIESGYKNTEDNE